MEYDEILTSIKNRKIKEEYRQEAQKLSERLIVASLSMHSIKNRVFTYFQMRDWLNDRPFEAFKDEIIFNSFIASLTQKGMKNSTISHTKVMAKGIIIWYFKDSSPAYLNSIKLEKFRKELNETELITPSDIKNIVSIASGDRNKALFITMYEGAFRISELLNIKLKDINFKEQETIVHIEVSKTKKRDVPLFDSTPYLLNWINNHPYKDNPEAYLFITFTTNYYGNQLKPCTIGGLLRTYAKRAGIKKYVYCHLLRHSRISWWAKVEKLNERDLRILAGWSEKSDMPNTYIHYDLDGVLDKMKFYRGIANTQNLEQEKQKIALNPIICPRCNKSNPAESMFCNCGVALTTKAYLKIDEIKKQEAELHQAIMQKGIGEIDTKGITDMKELMYQVLKSDPRLIEMLKQLTKN